MAGLGGSPPAGAGGSSSSSGDSGGGGAGMASWSVGQLRRFLQQRGLDSSGCVEKAELVALAERAAAADAPGERAASAAAAAAPPAPRAPSGAPTSGGGSADSFADALLASLREQMPTEITARLGEQLSSDPSYRAQLDAMGRQLSGQPAEPGDAVPLELLPGLVGYVPRDKVPEAQKLAAESRAALARASSGGGTAAADPAAAGQPGTAAAGAAAGPAGAAAKRCANCGAGSAPDRKLKMCGSCKQVRYCSAACQRAHWSDHKEDCRRLRQARQGS